MKQTIEIEVPDGKKAVWKEGKVVFEDLESKLCLNCLKHGKVLLK